MDADPISCSELILRSRRVLRSTSRRQKNNHSDSKSAKSLFEKSSSTSIPVMLQPGSSPGQNPTSSLTNPHLTNMDSLSEMKIKRVPSTPCPNNLGYSKSFCLIFDHGFIKLYSNSNMAAFSIIFFEIITYLNELNWITF